MELYIFVQVPVLRRLLALEEGMASSSCRPNLSFCSWSSTQDRRLRVFLGLSVVLFLFFFFLVWTVDFLSVWKL